MEADIRKLTRNPDDSDDEDEKKKKKPKVSYLAEELAKYSKGRSGRKGKGKKDEGDILAALNSFRGKLQASMDVESSEAKEAEDGEGLEVDDDTAFLSHRLTFPKDNEEESTKAERDYEVIDPRQRGARAKEEERERKRLANAGKGRKPGGSRR
jgi:peptidyl-prolyl cis-trans isomerase SDCCAG10